MTFHEVQFPADLSFGSSGGPERRTEIVALANGYEERNSPWKHSRRRFDAGVGMRSLDDVETLVSFFESRRGQLYGFRWKDWSDYKSCQPSQEPAFDDQVIGLGNGETRDFQLSKTYSSGDSRYTRVISKAVGGTVLIGLSGTLQTQTIHYDVDINTGSVSFFHPPEEGAEVTAGFEFDVPVRFDADAIHTSVASFQAGEVPNVPVVELRL